jgi:hypothetical protein
MRFKTRNRTQGFDEALEFSLIAVFRGIIGGFEQRSGGLRR